MEVQRKNEWITTERELHFLEAIPATQIIRKCCRGYSRFLAFSDAEAPWRGFCASFLSHLKCPDLLSTLSLISLAAAALNAANADDLNAAAAHIHTMCNIGGRGDTGARRAAPG